LVCVTTKSAHEISGTLDLSVNGVGAVQLWQSTTPDNT
jgi:hypothetical protein